MGCRGKQIFRPGQSPPPQLPRVFSRQKIFSAPGTFPAPGTSVRMKTVKGRRKAMRENRKLMVKEVLAVALAIVMLVVFQF